jgi:hypothetical protein
MGKDSLSTVILFIGSQMPGGKALSQQLSVCPNCYFNSLL